MKVGVTGASGFIGSSVVTKLGASSHETIGFSRSPVRDISGCWDVRQFSSENCPDLSGLDAIVHLAGASLLGIWTPRKKAEILESRIDTTRRIVESIAAMESASRPRVLACASAVGIYGNRGDESLDEETDAGFGFLANVAKQWEEVASTAETLGVRVVLLRIGFVLGPNGGAIPLLRKIFETGLGGNLGSGKQWMPWIHVDDVAGIIEAILENELIRGPVNVTSPNPVTNRDFTKTLGRALGKITALAVPSLVLKSLPGGMQEMFLHSLRVDPTVMKAHSYPWLYPDCRTAIEAAL